MNKTRGKSRSPPVRRQTEAIDAFVVKRDPQVPQTLSPRTGAKAAEMETIYTCLRNELSHERSTPIEDAKTEMAACVGDLRARIRRRSW